ncbi:MAG: prephenate dehydratase [Chloroflexota bacterium]|nr:MAG: prephenate dehydratase [Chloroflexota bacterium]
MTRAAFQGIAGAYSEEAIHQFFGPEVESIPCRTLADVFLAVESGDADYGMLPIENAVAGSVTRSYELLMEHDLRIYAEVILRVRHMLLALPGTKLDDVKRVRSHPQALAQCQHYLSRHGLEPEPAFDTAGSARDLAANPEPGVAVIASALSAPLYGLEILDRDIEDFAFNYTRFFVLATEGPPRAQRNKTSLVFTTPHQPGALYECLGEFARRHINLTKIESRPRLNRPWQYIFYLDFEGHCQDPECEAAIMGLLRRSSFIKLLGSYPAVTTPVPDNELWP